MCYTRGERHCLCFAHGFYGLKQILHVSLRSIWLNLCPRARLVSYAHTEGRKEGLQTPLKTGHQSGKREMHKHQCYQYICVQSILVFKIGPEMHSFHCIVLHCTALFCTALHCTAMHSIPLVRLSALWHELLIAIWSVPQRKFDDFVFMHFMVNRSHFRNCCFYFLTWLSALSAPHEPLHQFPTLAQMHFRWNCFDVMNYYRHKLVTAIFYSQHTF